MMIALLKYPLRNFLVELDESRNTYEIIVKSMAILGEKFTVILSVIIQIRQL